MFEAQWTLVTYTISYENLLGGTMPEEAIEEYTINTTFDVLIPTRTGYNFTGWTVAVSGTSDGLNVGNWPSSISAVETM